MNQRNPVSDQEELARRWFDDLFNRGELGTADEILAPDFTYNGPASLSPTDINGPDDVKEYVAVYQDAFPDLYYAIEEVFETDRGLCVRWSATGTHEGDLFGIEATGEGFSVNGIDVFQIEDDVIARIDAEWDTLKMVQELGLGPRVEFGGD